MDPNPLIINKRYRHKLIRVFLDNVIIMKPDECWPWIGSTRNRYGTFLYKGVYYQAHRFGYALFGPLEISIDMLVHHTCENKICCNPDHWLAMTPSEHMKYHRRMMKNRALQNQ